MMTEPLLHPRIDEIVRMIAGRGHHVDLVTNGLLLAEKAAELAAAGIDTIHVSLDGPEEVHDRIRGSRGLPASGGGDPRPQPPRPRPRHGHLHDLRREPARPPRAP